MLTNEELQNCVEDNESVDYFSNSDDDNPLTMQHYHPLATAIALRTVTCSNFQVGVCKDDCTVDMQWLGFDRIGNGIFGIIDLGTWAQEMRLIKYCPLSAVVRVLKSFDPECYKFVDYNELSGNVMLKSNNNSDSVLLYNVTNETETAYVCRSSHDYEKYFGVYSQYTVISTVNGVYVAFRYYDNYCKIEFEDFLHFQTFTLTNEIHLPHQVLAFKTVVALDNNRFLYYSFRDAEFIVLNVETNELTNVAFNVPDIIDQPMFRPFHVVGSDCIYGFCEDGLMKISFEGNTCNCELLNISLSVNIQYVEQNSSFQHWRFDIRDRHSTLMVNRSNGKFWSIFVKFSGSEYNGPHRSIVGHGRYLHLVSFTDGEMKLNLQDLATIKYLEGLKQEGFSLNKETLKMKNLSYEVFKNYM